MKTNLFIPTLQDKFIEVDTDAYNQWLAIWENHVKPPKIEFEVNNIVHVFEAKYNGSCTSTFTGSVNNENEFTYQPLKPFVLSYLCYYNGNLNTIDVPSHLEDIQTKFITFETLPELVTMRHNLLNRPSAAGSIPFTETDLAVFTETE